jgi:glutathione peroxidase
MDRVRTIALYDQPFELTTIDGQPATIGAWRGHVLLVVNVASRCGFTPQYAGLESLYRKHRAQRFAVLGFPCDQFGHQEPDDDAMIRGFCSRTYDVTFPMFSKVDVNGPGAHPLFEFLTSQKAGPLGMKRVMWNFTKFLISRDGQVMARHGPRTRPDAIEPAIVQALERA